jgi:hypothetical protein
VYVMITKPIRFIQITATTDHIFGLDEEGEVYYRAKPAHDFGTSSVTSYSGSVTGYQKKDEAEEKKVWKKCYMYYKVELPKGGAERDAQTAEDGEKPPETPVAELVIDEPARKIYKDVETVKKVQIALKEKGFYKKDGTDTYKIDGDLGHLTTTAIKAFQKSVDLKETGEVDLNLWNALNLNASNENETIIVLTDEVEDANEIFCGA